MKSYLIWKLDSNSKIQLIWIISQLHISNTQADIGILIYNGINYLITINYTYT